MAYTNAEARARLLGEVAAAADHLAAALASLSAAHEQLDDRSAERVEEELFRSVQRAYGRLKRLHADFASRHGQPAGAFPPAPRGLPSLGARALIERATAAAGAADQAIAELQDSMLPIEVGDKALRAELAAVRQLLDGLAAGAREVVRTLGR